VPALYRSSVRDFLSRDEDTIVGRLSGVASSAFTELASEQLQAWRQQIQILQSGLMSFSNDDSYLLLEYPIPRRGKRIDAVFIVGGLILVVEFKCGAVEYGRQARIQVEDYCLDLRDFHKGSLGRILVPILVATHATDRPAPLDPPSDSVAPVWLANAESLSRTLHESITRYGSQTTDPIDPEHWDDAEYAPTPTIVEAARILYEGHNVREISRCHAGAENLTRTSVAVMSAIQEAREKAHKVICFVTGVPGAGKTLAGLNIIRGAVVIWAG